MEQNIIDFIIYLEEVKNASTHTLQAYQNDLKKLLLYMEKQEITAISKISETSLNSYILSLEKDGYSPSSVTRNIASMKAFFLYLIKQGKIKTDPTERIKPPKVNRKSPQILNQQGLELLLKQPDIATHKGLRDRAMLELLYATGMKVSELLSIKLEDVNLSHKYITCRDRRERNIPIGRKAIKSLQEYIEIRSNFNKEHSELLFLNTNGQQLSRQGFWKILKTYANSAGLQDIMPNTLRHTFAVHLLDHGADLGIVQEFLGHADISTTQNYILPSNKNSLEVYKTSHPRA